MSSEIGASLTPGQQLSKARKSQGKSLAQIAEATCILPTRLEAIERDDFSAAGTAPTFVIGYVKAYAGQVDIDARPLVKILEAYFSHRELADAPAEPISTGRAPRVPLVSIIATVMALIVFMGLGRWYFSEQTVSVPPASTSPPAVSVDIGSSQPVLNGQSAVDFDTSLTDLPADIDPENRDVTDEFEAVPLSVVASESPVVEPVDAVAENSDAIGSDKLVLRFSGDCWLEVFDANRATLAKRLASAGQTISLTGVAPFDVKLGDVKVVSLSVNGRSVALNPVGLEPVLRLQVGP